jgi:copper chaperone CopZ
MKAGRVILLGALAVPLLGCCLLGFAASGTEAKAFEVTTTATAGSGLAVCELKVDGMTCGGCERSVNKALRASDAVKEAKADWKLGKAWVTYDPAKVKPEDLASLVSAAGYAATPQSGTAATGKKTGKATIKGGKKSLSGVTP